VSLSTFAFLWNACEYERRLKAEKFIGVVSMKGSYPKWLRIIVMGLAVALFIFLGVTNYQFALESPGGNDFLARWMGARFWVTEGISPYNPQVSLETQRIIYGRPAFLEQGEDIAHFVYPMPAMLFFAPFGIFQFPLARAIWMTILEISLPILALFGLRLSDWKPRLPLVAAIVLFSIFWYHGLRSIIIGQFAVLEALLMIGALLAIHRGNDGLAGILLGLSIAKPQMPVLLIPLVLLWAWRADRRRIVFWTLGSIAAQVLFFLVLMPDWPIQWLRQLLEYPSYTSLGPPVSILADFVPMFSGVISACLTAALLLYMLWEWFVVMGKNERWFQWTAAMTIVITNLVAIRTATTNYVVMLPAMILIFADWTQRWKQAGERMSLAAMLLYLIGIWALFLTTLQEGNVEHPVVYLPLPFLLLVGLWWSRRRFSRLHTSSTI
jgi:hypothetical protein